MASRVANLTVRSTSECGSPEKGADSAFKLRLNIIMAEETTVGLRTEEEHSLGLFCLADEDASPMERRQLDELHNSTAKLEFAS